MKRLLLLFLFVSVLGWGDLWYLDNAASGTNAGTSWINAWEAYSDITWGVGGVVAGDTLYISGGSTSKTYSGFQFTVGESGSSGSPITISVSSEASHNGIVIFDGGDTVTIGIYCYRNYITLYGNEGQWKVQDFTSRQIRTETVSNVTIDGIHILDSEAEAAIRIKTNTDSIIKNCKITTSTSFIGTTDGIYSEGNDGNEYHHNWIGVYNSDATSHNDCIQLYDDTDTTVYSNYAEQVNNKTENAQGIYGTECYGSIIYYNNVVYNPNGNNALAYRNITVGTATFTCYGNTVTGGGNALLYLTGVADPLIKNNIWNYSSSTEYAIKLYDWSGTYANVNNNLMYSPNQSTPFYTTTARTWAQWQTDGYDANGINDDPDLDSSSEYELNSGSPAINQGATLSSPYNVDKDSNVRPQGVAWDMGAYERKQVNFLQAISLRFLIFNYLNAFMGLFLVLASAKTAQLITRWLDG